jgi:hypothetical protein
MQYKQKEYHYISEMYLKRFVDPVCPPKQIPFLHYFDVVNRKWGKKSAENLCVKNNLYCFTDKNGVLNNTREKEFSKIEDNAERVISKIEQQVLLNRKDKENLSLFIALFFNRPVVVEKGMREFNSKINKWIMLYKNIYSSKGSNGLIEFKVKYKEIENEEWPFSWTQEQMDTKEMVDIDYDKETSLKVMFDDAPHLAEILLSMEWVFYIAENKDGKCFITSDCPICLLNYVPTLDIKIDLKNVNLSVLFPLSPNTCLNMTWKQGHNLCYKTAAKSGA